MQIQLSHRSERKAGEGDFWILTCDLYKREKLGDDVPVVNLCIKHQGGGGAFEKVLLHFDEHSGESRLIVTEEEYQDLIQDYVDHVEGADEKMADDVLSQRYATDEYCHVAFGWNPLKKAEEMRKRWEAIKLLVNPHVTL